MVIGDNIPVVPVDPDGGDDAPLISADGFKVPYNGRYVSIKDICRTYAGCSYENANAFKDDKENTLVGTPFNSLDSWNTNINLPYYQGGQQLRWILKDSKPNFNGSTVISLLKYITPIPTYYRIYISNNTLKIDYYSASSTWVEFESYSTSDFIDGVVPKRILVALQAGGGSGGNGNWNTAGSGGGGGAGWIGILNIESMVYISIGAGGASGVGEVDGNPGSKSYINHVSGGRAITLGGGSAGKYGDCNSYPAGGKVTLTLQYQGVLYWTLLSVNGGYGGRAGNNALGNKVDATPGKKIPSCTIYSTNVTADKTSANRKILSTQSGGKPDYDNLKMSGGGGGASLFGRGGNSYVEGSTAEAGQQGAGGGGAREFTGQSRGGAGGRGICLLYLPLK